jgi:uncharacterized phage protein (TIGR01671 family)
MEQRIIKFRAWSKILKEMLPNVQNHIGNDGWGFGSILNNEKDFKVMQFTGRLDKNEKEIYESDHVIYTLNHDSSQIKIESTVEWHNHAWRLNRIWLLTEIDTIEVIGNIFETPELLK